MHRAIGRAAWPGLALAVLFCATPAEARLTVCNKAAEPVRVALGQQEGDAWASRGWWRIEPGQCRQVIETTLSMPEYFLRAEPLKPGQGWGGEFPFCVADSDFQDKGDEMCERRAKKTAGFFAIHTDGATAVTHNLTD